MVLFFICKQRRFPLYPAELFRPGLFTLRLFLRYSLLILFNEFMWALGQSVFTSILGHASASADLLAAFAVISSIDKLAMVACYGLADAAAILLGHWLGQGAEKENIYRLGCRLLRIFFLYCSVRSCFPFSISAPTLSQPQAGCVFFICFSFPAALLITPPSPVFSGPAATSAVPLLWT